MRNPSPTRTGGFVRFAPRKVTRALVIFCLLLLAALSVLYFRQHSMVYHPRPYDQSYAYAFPANGVEINYTVATAKYCAYYIPATAPLPKRLWIAFCGNGSLALDCGGRARFCNAPPCTKSGPDCAIHNAPGGSSHDVGWLGRTIADRKL